MPTMRNLITIVESGQPGSLFHASGRALSPGTILRPGSISQFTEREAWLEEHRPAECLPRSASVFMTERAEQAKMWGKYLYEVRPIGRVERNDITWFEALLDLDDRDEWDDDERYPEGYAAVEDRMRDAAMAYWTGQPHDGWWEYRARGAEILRPA